MAPAAPATLHELFASAAARHPNRPALEVGGRTLTYAQLDRFSDRLAGQLLFHAERHPARVGLLAARSVTAYAGYLAALRIGAAAVPMNPAHPPTRHLAVVKGGALDLVLGDGSGRQDPQEAAAHLGTPFLLADEVLLHRLDQDRSAPETLPAPPRPDDTAYLLYTSGSTGTPRGVPILHRNIAPFIDWSVRTCGFGPEDRTSQNVELTFDVAVYEMFVTWAAGGTLVVPRPNDVMRPSRFVAEHRITHWFCVPSVGSVAARVGALEPGSMPTLTKVMFGGERLIAEQARQWAEAAPNAELRNMYGPTEVSVVCVQKHLGRRGGLAAGGSNGTMPIGEVLPHLEGSSSGRTAGPPPRANCACGDRSGSAAISTRPTTTPGSSGGTPAPPPSSCPRVPNRRTTTGTAPATWYARRAAVWSSWEGWTTRSRCAAIVSRWGRSRPSSPTTLRSVRRSWPRRRPTPERHWWRTTRGWSRRPPS